MASTAPVRNGSTNGSTAVAELADPRCMQFPASAVTSLIEGYCADFVALSAIFAQTLEQVSMRNLNFDASRPSLQRIEHGMRQLADAIQELLERHERGDAKACPTTATAPPTTSATASITTNANAAPTSVSTRSIPKSAFPPKSSAPTPTAAAGGNPWPAPTDTKNDGKSEARAERKTGEHKLADLWAEGKPGTTPTAAAATPPAAPSAPTTAVAPSNRPRPATTNAPRQAANQSRFGTRREGTKPEGLRGNSQSMPLLSVFQFLGRMRKMGTMKVHVADEQMTFELDNGCVLFTTSDHCPTDERLGELLVEQGACTNEQIEELVAELDSGAGELFGQLAVKQGVVTQAQVVKALEDQVRRRFLRACKTPESTYEFLEGVRSGSDGMFRIQPVAVG
jgi:hypothetical protein